MQMIRRKIQFIAETHEVFYPFSVGCDIRNADILFAVNDTNYSVSSYVHIVRTGDFRSENIFYIGHCHSFRPDSLLKTWQKLYDSDIVFQLNTTIYHNILQFLIAVILNKPVSQHFFTFSEPVSQLFLMLYKPDGPHLCFD